MTELERRLAELGERWDAPATPDIATLVMAQLPARTRRSRPRLRLRYALAVCLIAVGTLAAIAPARDAILDFFGVGGARITTSANPPAPNPTPVQPGVPVDGADFPVRLPALEGLGTPTRTFVRDVAGQRVVVSEWARPEVSPATLTLTQFQGPLVIEKVIDPDVTTVERLTIDGADSAWLTGGPHVVAYLDDTGKFQTETLRQAGDVLLWERDGITYRIEGARDREEALRIARSLR